MMWKEEMRAEIEALTDPSEVKVRRLFKRIRRRIREGSAGHEAVARLQAKFKAMKRFERRDHVAMLREVYLECLDDETRAKVEPHSARRAADPMA